MGRGHRERTGVSPRPDSRKWGPHCRRDQRWAPAWSGCHPARTVLWLGLGPRPSPPKQDLRVQSSPNVPGFLSPSLADGRTPKDSNKSKESSCLKKKKLKVLNLLSLRLVVRTAWKLHWQLLLSVSWFLLNHFTVVTAITTYRHVHGVDHGCALSGLWLHNKALRVTAIPIRGGA